MGVIAEARTDSRVLRGDGIVLVEWGAHTVDLARTPTPNGCRSTHANPLVVSYCRLDGVDGLEFPSRNGYSRLLEEAYRKWGSEMGNRVRGEFAFVVHDPESQQTVLCRDRIGIHQLYYYFAPNNRLVFSSDLGLLMQLPSVPRIPNDLFIARHLVLHDGDQGDTAFGGVHRVPPSHSLRFSASRMTARRYWSLEDSPTIGLPTTDDYVAAFRHEFERAVQSRVGGTSVVGCALSGGLDSSAVAVALARTLPDSRGRLKVFSYGFPETPSSDESPSIRATVERLNLDSRLIAADEVNPFEFEPTPVEPLPFSNLFLHATLLRQARSAGVTDFFDGFGGDQCISNGELRLVELASGGDYRGFVRESSRLANRTGRRPARIMLAALRRTLSSSLPIRVHRLLRGEHRIDTLGVLSQSLRCRCGSALERDLNSLVRPRNARDSHIADLSTTVESYVTGFVEPFAARFGMRIHFPFLDVGLLQFAVGLPTHLKMQNGWTRYATRCIYHRELPPQVVWAPTKSDLTEQLRRKVLRHYPSVLQKLRMNPDLKQYVSPNAASLLVSGILAGNRLAVGSFCRLAELDVWLRKWFGSGGNESLLQCTGELP